MHEHKERTDRWRGMIEKEACVLEGEVVGLFVHRIREGTD